MTEVFLRGIFKNGNWLYDDQPIARSVLSDGLDERFNLKTTPLKMSVQSMESLIEKDKSGVMLQPLTVETCGMIAREYHKMGNPFFELISANREFSKSAFVQALSEIRFKLLELMLVIDEDYGGIDLNELINQNQKINILIRKIMITNNIMTGDGNIQTNGSENSINAQININKGSKEDLKKELEKNGVNGEDIAEIIEIIDVEEPDRENNKPGKEVSSWMKKMMGKSIDGSWQVGVGAAGKLLADIIAKYYGF